MEPFDCKDYRDALRGIFAARSEVLNLTQSLLAEKVNVQPPFLSKVFSKKAHFSREQLDLCLHGLKCQRRICDFVFLLHDLNLSSDPCRKERLLKQIKSIALEPRSVTDFVANAETVREAAALSRYFCNPLYALVHMALTINELRENPSLLASVLKIEYELVNKSILALIDCDVISIDATGKIHLRTKDIQIDRSHEQFDAWRLATLELMKLLERNSIKKSSIQVQGFFSIPAMARSKIKEKLVNLVNELKDLSEGQPESKLAAINLNYFEIN